MKPICQKCDSSHDLVDDICTRCWWNVVIDREADESEMLTVKEKLDGAIEGLKEALNAPATKQEMAVIAKYDQFGAQLRDMSAEERESVASNLAEDGSLSLEDARDWVARLIQD